MSSVVRKIDKTTKPVIIDWTNDSRNRVARSRSRLNAATISGDMLLWFDAFAFEVVFHRGNRIDCRERLDRLMASFPLRGSYRDGQ